MGQIVYIGNFQFPLGDAVAKRVLGVGTALREAGYIVSFIGENKDVSLNSMSEDFVYDGFRYCSLHKPTSAREHYYYRKDIELIKEKLIEWGKKDSIDIVFFCGMKCAFMAAKMLKLCKQMKIATIADSMDWLKAHTGNVVFDLIKQADIEYELRVVNKKANGVMTISQYLADYYLKNNQKVIVVPPLSPYHRECYSPTENKIPLLVYAGIPCRLGQPLKNAKFAKDRLDIAVALLYQVYLADVFFELKIYGISKEDYNVVFPQQKDIVQKLVENGFITFYGYVNETVVREAVIQADYTILIREKNRVSMAGFPTKVSESITLGTPVITTDTSDIKNYLSEDVCYFIDLHNLYEAGETLRRILSSDATERTRNKILSLKNDSFEPKKYAEVLVSFIKRCKNEDKI